MQIADKAVRTAKLGRKPFQLADVRGLSLLVNPDGSGSGASDSGSEGRRASSGTVGYPDTILALAREEQDDARRLLARGINPAEQRRAVKSAAVAEGEAFEVIALEWIARETPGWAPARAERVEQRLQNDVSPFIGSTQVATLTAPEILGALKRITE